MRLIDTFDNVDSFHINHHIPLIHHHYQLSLFKTHERKQKKTTTPTTPTKQKKYY